MHPPTTTHPRVDEPITIDGSQGEGGGQMLRSSLSLAALLGRELQIERIRAGRRKPGLLRQHLTAVRAAKELTEAEAEGDALGSSRLRFRPRTLLGGSHRFAIGSAGSASLVCQTVLPIALRAPTASALRFEGGTHNSMAPPFEFLSRVFLPLLGRVGFKAEATLFEHGFYPAGGGAFELRVTPSGESEGEPNQPLELLDAAPIVSRRAHAIAARLPKHVLSRELAVLEEAFGLEREERRSTLVRSAGPGNIVSLELERADGTRELFTAFGEKGRKAEEVASDVVAEAKRYLEVDAPVGEHLADQLLIPLLLVGGRYRTGALSSHAETNIMLLRSVLGAEAVSVEREGRHTLVEVNRCL